MSKSATRTRQFSTGFSYSHGPNDWTPNGYESGPMFHRTSEETERCIAQVVAAGSDVVINRISR